MLNALFSIDVDDVLWGANIREKFPFFIYFLSLSFALIHSLIHPIDFLVFLPFAQFKLKKRQQQPERHSRLCCAFHGDQNVEEEEWKSRQGMQKDRCHRIVENNIKEKWNGWNSILIYAIWLFPLARALFSVCMIHICFLLFWTAHEQWAHRAQTVQKYTLQIDILIANAHKSRHINEFNLMARDHPLFCFGDVQSVWISPVTSVSNRFDSIWFHSIQIDQPN